MKTAIITLSALLVLLGEANAQQLEVDLKTLKLDITFRGREFIKKRTGLVEGFVRIVPAGTGSVDSLFANKKVTTLKERIIRAAVEQKTGKLFLYGVYEGDGIGIRFVRVIHMSTKKSVFLIVEAVDFKVLPVKFAITEHSLVLPLEVAKDEHHRMFAFGGRERVEMFRMDMNDQHRRTQYISDKRAFRPYWDIGGVLQLATGYQIWRANHADTRRYVVEEGKGAPGWADYSEIDCGITVKVEEPQKLAPWSMRIDARKGEFVISPKPPGGLPIAGKDYRTEKAFAFRLILHGTSWPALHPCELPPESYKKLLDYLNSGKGHNHLRYVGGALGITVGKTKEEIYRAFIDTERVQPSVLLRPLYRGDAWRMSGVVKGLLGKSAPRRQPFEVWEKLTQEIFAKLRKDVAPEAKE